MCRPTILSKKRTVGFKLQMLRALVAAFLVLLNSFAPLLPVQAEQFDADTFVDQLVDGALGFLPGANLIDMYDKLSKTPDLAKGSMIKALNQKLQKALLDNDTKKADVIQAYLTAIATDDNSRLKELLTPSAQKPPTKSYWIIDLAVPPIQAASDRIKGTAAFSTPQKLPGTKPVEVRFSLRTANQPNEVLHAEKTITVPDKDTQFSISIDSLDLKLPSNGDWKLIVTAKCEGYESSANMAPITSGSIVVDSATATPAPNGGKPVKLNLRYHLDGGRGQVVIGGHMESVPDSDNPAIHRQNLPDRTAQAAAIPNLFEDSWPANNVGGKYEWHYRIRSDSFGEKTGVVPFTLPKLPKPKEPRKIEIKRAILRLDAPASQPSTTFAPGDKVLLEVEYELSTDKNNKPLVDVVESSKVDGPESKTLAGNRIKRPCGTHTYKESFTASKVGPYDWRFEIELPEGMEEPSTNKDSLHFVVKQKSQARIVVDSAVGLPNPQFAGSDMSLDLKFHTDGDIGEKIQYTGFVENPAGTRESISQELKKKDDSWPLAKHAFRPPDAGTYKWHYELVSEDGTQKTSGDVSLQVNSVAKIKGLEIVSQQVINPEGYVGDTFTLRVKYKVRGLGGNKSWVDASETSEIVGQSIGTMKFPAQTRRINWKDETIVKEIDYKATAAGLFEWRTRSMYPDSAASGIHFHSL